MQSIRSACRRFPLLAALVALAALALRLAVPAGYMPGTVGDRLILILCPDGGPPPIVMTMAHDGGHGMEHHGDADPLPQGACAFADLALPVIGGADPIQLAAALLFIVAAAPFALVPLPARAIGRWRPPLRGPPAFG